MLSIIVYRVISLEVLRIKPQKKKKKKKKSD